MYSIRKTEAYATFYNYRVGGRNKTASLLVPCMSLSEVAKLVLFGEASTGLCVLCGIQLCTTEQMVCTLHAGQVTHSFQLDKCKLPLSIFIIYLIRLDLVKFFCLAKNRQSLKPTKLVL